MEESKSSLLERLNSKWITPLFAIVAVVYGFIFKVTNDKIENNSAELDNLTKQINNELRVKEFDNNLKMVIYNEVKDAIKSKGDSTLQKATLIVVNEMLKDDTLFREKLKTVLLAATASKELMEVQNNIDQFSTEQAAVVTPAATSSGGFKIDVFYLDDVLSEAKPRAEEVVKLIKTVDPKSTVRLRLLPKEVNARSGYRVDANQIRYEAKESAFAKKVLAAIKAQGIFNLEQPALHQTSYSTPNYISIFVRNM